MPKCYYCKEEKEVGKELFWCPRLRSYDNGLTFYGSWVCLSCCKDTFFQSIHNMHLSRSFCGSCGQCDFPIGAILDANKYKSPPDEFIVIKRQDKWFIQPKILTSSVYDYFGFKWDHHRKGLILIRRSFVEGICTLVLKEKKLPTRKVILLEDTIFFNPLSWNELNHYYYSSCGYKQHFREEKWMDQAPVIICSGYLNEEGFQFDEKFKKKIESLKKKIIAEEL